MFGKGLTNYCGVACLVMALFVLVLTQSACTREQLKANTYQAIHKREQIQCQQQNLHDCPEYESYQEYERKRREAQ